MLNYSFENGAYTLVKDSEKKIILGDYVEIVNNIVENKNFMDNANIDSAKDEREKKSLKRLIADLRLS